MSDTDEHITHIERSHDGTYYFWCEAEDCYAPTARRYETEVEVFAAAEMHAEHPG